MEDLETLLKENLEKIKQLDSFLLTTDCPAEERNASCVPDSAILVIGYYHYQVKECLKQIEILKSPENESAAIKELKRRNSIQAQTIADFQKQILKIKTV